MNSIKYTFAPAQKFFAVMAIFALVAMPLAQVSAGDHQIRICHATGGSNTSEPNVPKAQIYSDMTATEGANAHGSLVIGVHPDDIIPPFSAGSQGGQTWGDYPGKNWDVEGQAIWNNDCVVPTTPKADLSVVKTIVDDISEVNENGQFTYEIKVTNLGPDTATNVLVTDLIPTELTVETQPDSWNLGTILKDETKTITVLVSAKPVTSDTVVTNTASADGTEEDTVSTNNSSSVDVTVKDVPSEKSVDLQVTKTVVGSVTTVDEGSQITYNIAVKNLGPDYATGVKVTDVIPAGLTFSYSSPSPLTLGDIAVGGTQNVTIVVYADEINTDSVLITNTAFAQGNEKDPNLSNNEGSVDVTVMNIDPTLGSISGSKYEFETDNKLSGWTIFIDEDADKMLDTEETFVVTVDGNYVFNNLSAGTYSVCEVNQTGWTQKAPETGCFEIILTEEKKTVNDSTGNNFWNQKDEIVTYTITGYKWNDLNKNGVLDDGEPKLADWTIEAEEDVAEPGAPISAVTNSDGYYSLEVPAGDWVVSEVQKPGWAQSAPSDPNYCPFTFGAQSKITRTSDSSNTCNFGNYEIDDTVLSCDSFKSDDYSVRSGQKFILSWDMTGALGVYLKDVQDEFGLKDSYETSVSGDKEFTLMVDVDGDGIQTGEGSRDLECKLDIDRRSSGGGGSSSHRKGSVLGETTDRPVGDVAGESTTMPAGAPNTGAGGTSPLVVSLPSLIAVLGGRASVRQIK